MNHRSLSFRLMVSSSLLVSLAAGEHAASARSGGELRQGVSNRPAGVGAENPSASEVLARIQRGGITSFSGFPEAERAVVQEIGSTSGRDGAGLISSAEWIDAISMRGGGRGKEILDFGVLEAGAVGNDVGEVRRMEQVGGLSYRAISWAPGVFGLMVGILTLCSRRRMDRSPQEEAS